MFGIARPSRHAFASISLGLAVLSIGSGHAGTQESAAKPKGHVAEVTDKSGTKLTVYGFSFGYTYGYTRSNCAFSCGASADAEMRVLPLNEGCGTTMVPLKEITSISGITSAAYNEPSQATITFVDGRQLKAGFGKFDGRTLREVRGQSPFGPYSLSLDKAAQIVFQPDRNVPPVEEDNWGSAESKATAQVTCPNDAVYSLSAVAAYYEQDNGRVFTAKTLTVKMGESEIKLEFDRIKAVARKSGSSTDPKFVVTTSTGDAVDMTFGRNEFVGGYRDGHFFYADMKDLKGLTVSR